MTSTSTSTSATLDNVDPRIGVEEMRLWGCTVLVRLSTVETGVGVVKLAFPKWWFKEWVVHNRLIVVARRIHRFIERILVPLKAQLQLPGHVVQALGRLEDAQCMCCINSEYRELSFQLRSVLQKHRKVVERAATALAAIEIFTVCVKIKNKIFIQIYKKSPPVNLFNN